MSAAAAQQAITLVASELESQSLNAIVAGFSFAAALSWVDLVRWLVNQVIKVNKNGGMNYTLTALLTTLLSIFVFMGTSRLSSKVSKPSAPVFAVTK